MYDKRLLIKLVDWCGRLRDPRKCIRISFMRYVFKELIQHPAGSVGQLSISEGEQAWERKNQLYPTIYLNSNNLQ